MFKDRNWKSLYKFKWWRKGAFIRALICWSIGMSVLLIDERDSFDLRFKLRGTRPPSGDVVLVEISRTDFLALTQKMSFRHLGFHPANYADEELFTNSTAWSLILRQLLDLNPRKIGISLSVDKGLQFFPSSPEERVFLQNPKVIWGAKLDADGRLKDPSFIRPINSNVGAIQSMPDPDLVYRRFQPPSEGTDDFIALLSERKQTSSQVINFQGPRGTFRRLALADLMADPDRRSKIEGKIVLLGKTEDSSFFLNTPVGPMPRLEFFANILEGSLHDKWIRRLHPGWYNALLLILLAASIWVLFRYPQSVAFVFFLWIGTALTALSVWIFDSYQLWLPVLSPLVQLSAAYVIFISFQLAIQEKNHWRLTQEARAFQEIEQLKNNFVSLFSHDLKTPIAKIQAIVDRLLTQQHGEEISADLKSLRRSSDELYRYIQKIIQISRVESRKIKLNKESADINEIVDEVVRRMDPLARERGITIQTERPPLFSVEIDRTLIEEVLLNLLDNAIKYSPSGGRISVSTAETDENVVVTVCDQGHGISEDAQTGIWNKFTRGKDHGEDVEGFGLGLYLARYFIELHGGEIALTSEPGKGTTVRFTLPFETRTAASGENVRTDAQDATLNAGMEWL